MPARIRWDWGPVKSSIAFIALVNAIVMTLGLLGHVVVRDRPVEIVWGKIICVLASVAVVVIVFGQLGLGRLIARLSLTSSDWGPVWVMIIAAAALVTVQGCSMLHEHLLSGRPFYAISPSPSASLRPPRSSPSC